MNTDVQVSESNEIQSYQDTSNLVMDVEAMNHMMKVADFMAGGTLTLPEPYRKNPANCLAVVMQSAQWKMNPYSVAQKTHFVNGTIGYEAQLVAAVITQSRVTTGAFEFEWYGEWEKILGKFKEVESKSKKDDYGNFKKFKIPNWNATDEVGLGIKVSATLRGENKPRVLDLLLTQANTRNSTVWADDPRQQLAYLAQKRWARLYAPGVILGVYTQDELEETRPVEKEINPVQQTQTGAAAANNAQTQGDLDQDQNDKRQILIDILQPVAEKEGLAAYQEAWEAITTEERKLVGAEQHGEFKVIASEFDAKAAQSSDFSEAYNEADKPNA